MQHLHCYCNLIQHNKHLKHFTGNLYMKNKTYGKKSQLWPGSPFEKKMDPQKFKCPFLNTYTCM